jgi:hypothetical protein
MARKRGGLAGIWDRNKGVIKTLAPAALSFVPGLGIPLAAAAGAAMGGFDRPGKGGIGFDIGGGVAGGLKGAAIGAGAQGVRGLLTGGGPMGGALPSPKMNVGVTKGVGGLSQSVSAPAAGGSSGAGMLKSLGTFARENKDLIGAGAKGIQMAMPDPGSEAAMMNAETTRMRFDTEKSEMERQREREARIAELLMPYLSQQGYFSSSR